MVNQRFVFLTFLVGAAFIAGVLNSAVSAAFLEFSVEDAALLGGTVTTSGVLAGVGGLATFVALLRNARAVRFTDEVISELRKVTWPTREETLEASTTVIATSIFVALLISGYDLVWKTLASLFLFSEG